MSNRFSKPFVVAVALLTLASCEGLTLPYSEQSLSFDELTVVRVAPDAPPLYATQVSFWIVRGEQREVEIRYAGANGYTGKCIRLVVPADAPLRHADGRVFAVGDSVWVTVRVLDPQLFLFEFDPGGILFNPATPAYMEVRYRWMAEDQNGDGVVDEADRRIAGRFGIWSESGTGGRWKSVPAVRDGGEQEIHAPVAAFTKYALASD